jgi:serine phosphatase RsbU (regulator of sigma subunit)
MKSLLHKKRKHKHGSIAPIGVTFPKLRNGEIAAVATCGHRKNFCDSFRANSVRVLFGLLEFSGHLHQTSKLFPIVQETFRTAGVQAFSARDINESDAMAEVCLRLNRSLIDAAGPAHSCPAFVGCYNEDLGTVCYVNAGHPPALVRHSSDFSELSATGLPLGLFSHTTLEAGIIALEPGAVMIVVSKEVVETESGGEGLRRVSESLRSFDGVSAHDLCMSLIQVAQQHSRQAKTHELTALSLIRRIT